MNTENAVISNKKYKFALVDDETFYHARIKELLLRFFPECIYLQ